MAETLHLVCASCGSVNRVPQARLDDDPKCGRCRGSVLADHPIDLSSANFRRHVESNELPVVVDFWAPWCGPCVAMAPQLTAAAKELSSDVRVFKVNTDAESNIASEFAIRSIPTLILFKGCREVARQSGSKGKADLVRWIRSHSAA